MSSTRRQPQRTCLGCRQAQAQNTLIRFVCSPEGEVLADTRSRLPGRGAYCCWDWDCLTQAVSKKQFDRAFKRSCRTLTVDQLVTQVEQALLTHMTSLIGMARKSSKLIAGSQAVLDALSQPERFALLLVATDISAGVGDKVRNKAAHLGVECVELFNKVELGRILGRSEHSVLGLYVGPLAEAFKADLYKYRDMSGES